MLLICVDYSVYVTERVYAETDDGENFAALRKAFVDGLKGMHLAGLRGQELGIESLIGRNGVFAVVFFNAMEEERLSLVVGE